MQSELFPSAAGQHHCQHQQATCAAVETGTCPDGSPSISRNQLLEIMTKVSSCRDGSIYMRVTECGPTYGKTSLQWIAARNRLQKLKQSDRERPGALKIRQVRGWQTY